MSQLEILGSAKARRATNVATGQQGPNPAGNAETTTDMEVEEDSLPRNSEEGDNDLITDELIDYNEDGTAAAVNAAAKADKVKNLREMFASKGKEYRTLLKSEKVKDLFTSTMTVEMSAEDILSEIPNEELHNVGVVKGLLIMPPGFVQKYILPAIKVRKALKLSNEGNLPGGIETAIMFAFFDDSVMDYNNTIGDNLIDNAMIRAMVNHAKDHTLDYTTFMREGSMGLRKGTTAALKQLGNVSKLPKQDELWDMKDPEIESRNEDIADAMKQYEAHTWKDHDDLLLLREQQTLLANLVWEQQIQICNLNDKYLRLLEERKNLVDVSHKPVYDSVDLINETITTLHKRMLDVQKTLDQRHDTMSQLLTPVDTVKIRDAMRKLEEALCEATARNAELARRNNQLTIELSFMPPKMHDMIMQAKRSHSNIYSNQRTDPHYLVPETPMEFAFERADPHDKRLSLLQRCATYYSVSDLLDETRDLTHNLMSIDGSDRGATKVDKNDNGNNADGADGNTPINAQDSLKGDDVGNRKRNHDSIVQRGHQPHTHQVQRMNATSNFPKEVNQNIPDLTNQGSSVEDANMQEDAFPETEQQTAFIESAHFGGPQNSYAPIGRQSGEYEIFTEDPMSLDDISSDPTWRGKARFAPGKGKGKARGKGRGKMNANNPHWDKARTVIPKFGAQLGIIHYAIGDLKMPHLQYSVQPTRPFETTGLSPGQRIKMIDTTLVRERNKPGQFPDQNIVLMYYKALDAIYSVNASIEYYLLTDDHTRQIVTLNRTAVGSSRGQNPDTHGLLEEIQKKSLGDYWRVLRTRPANNATKAKNPDIEYIPNNTYPYYLVKKTLEQKYYPNIKVRPSRYWNETAANDIADDLIYALSDYWPGMPMDCDIVRDNISLGLHAYRSIEMRFGKADPANNKAPIDATATINQLVTLRAIPDSSQQSLKDYMSRVQAMDDKYAHHVGNWPFLVAQRLLKMQVSRLRMIKIALTEKLDDHPLSSANSASFSNVSIANQMINADPYARNIPYYGESGYISAQAVNTPQSGGASGNLSQSAIRPGYENLGGRGQ